jgi:hypothetical protein
MASERDRVLLIAFIRVSRRQLGKPGCQSRAVRIGQLGVDDLLAALSQLLG